MKNSSLRYIPLESPVDHSSSSSRAIIKASISEETIRLKHKEFSLPVSLPLSSVSTCPPLSVLSVIYHKHSLILSIFPAFLFPPRKAQS